MTLIQWYLSKLVSNVRRNMVQGLKVSKTLTIWYALKFLCESYLYILSYIQVYWILTTYLSLHFCMGAASNIFPIYLDHWEEFHWSENTPIAFCIKLHHFFFTWEIWGRTKTPRSTRPLSLRAALHNRAKGSDCHSPCPACSTARCQQKRLRMTQWRLFLDTFSVTAISCKSIN